MDTKAQIRELMRIWRSSLDQETVRAWSERICFHLRSQERFARARTIHSFWPMVDRAEVDIRPVLREACQDGRTLWLPVVQGKRLGHALLTSEDSLQPARFGQLEPSGPLLPHVEPDIILVPALAVDRSGARVGYGGGYYDRFLRGQSAWRVGVVFSHQVLPSLPIDPHDERLDAVVTEAGWLDVLSFGSDGSPVVQRRGRS